LTSETSVITEFAIVPYAAFWHPENPTYAPISVSISFFHSSLGVKPYFTSPQFSVEKVMKMQVFKLPLPAVFVENGYVRVNFNGMQQRQTLGAMFDQFYTCISFVGIYGTPLSKDLNFDSIRTILEPVVTVRIWSENANLHSYYYLPQRATFNEVRSEFEKSNNLKNFDFFDIHGSKVPFDSSLINYLGPEKLYVSLSAVVCA
jgi:hypothetical protein